MKKALLFDLDGTLLPLEMSAFIPGFFDLFMESGVLEVIKQDDRSFSEALMHMLRDRHPEKTNEQAFNDKLSELTGIPVEDFNLAFDGFYREHFVKLKEFTECEPLCVQAVRLAKSKGYKIILATNPLFPRVATDMRIRWAGLDRDDFDHITYIDQTHFCKPDSDFFAELLEQNSLQASECVMFGNSVLEDGCANHVGIDVYIIKTHIDGEHRGENVCLLEGYSDMMKIIEGLPEI